MARKNDSGWRDTQLTSQHERYGFGAPAAGMILPMIEYDRGKAVGIVSYQQDFHKLPKGHDVRAAHRAFGRLRSADGLDELPFLTACYDARDWSFHVMPHNDAGRRLTGVSGNKMQPWIHIHERAFAGLLYKMRGRDTPNLSAWGVTWNQDFGSDGKSFLPLYERWPGQAMSMRRRNYEPKQSVPFRMRIPCMDVDLAVVDREEDLAAVVDYKLAGSKPTELRQTNFTALASLTGGSGIATTNVAAFVTEYTPGPGEWSFRVHCLNRSASLLLCYALGASGAAVSALADAVAGSNWVPLSEREWLDVLRVARDV